MTIDHGSALWGFGGSPTSATIAGQQGGYRCGRQFPVCPSTAGASGTIRPYVIPWTAASDSFGVAFPAGIVGVVVQAPLPSPLTGNLNTDLETKWADLTGGSTIIPVPAVLPGGYTASAHVPWRTAAWNLTRLPTAAGWTAETWVPCTSPNGISQSGSFLEHYTELTSLIGTGVRKLRFRLTTADLFIALPAFSWTLTFSHNANGSSVGSADGDTIDATVTVTQADFTQIGATFRWQTALIDIGALTPVLGVSTAFSVNRGSPSDPHGGMWYDFQLSPKCDVPYPVSIAGQGDLIAPGGYV